MYGCSCNSGLVNSFQDAKNRLQDALDAEIYKGDGQRLLE